MQTFLPYSSFYETAKVLDRQRLGKQRVETMQILKTLLGETEGWSNHPTTLMWEGYEPRLAVYGLYMCSEWRYRGYEDSLFPWFEEQRLSLIRQGVSTVDPPWMGDEDFHMSHRMKLLWKMPEHYQPIFGLAVPEEEPEYVWPESMFQEF